MCDSLPCAAWWPSTSEIFLNLVMLARLEDMFTNRLNHTATTVLATGFFAERVVSVWNSILATASKCKLQYW